LNVCRTALCALLCLGPAAGFGQEFRATVAGTVTDTTGAAIPGVAITLRETRTGTNGATISDSIGQYVVPFLAPGDRETVTIVKPHVRMVGDPGDAARVLTVWNHAPLSGFRRKDAVHVCGRQPGPRTTRPGFAPV
jgi:hypothetical protein